MLGGSVDFYEPVDSDYGGEYSEEARTVEGVYFEASVEMSARGYQLVDGCKGVLFIDAVNSAGAFRPVVGSLAVYGGEEMTVAKVTAYRTPAEVHHWEVELV